MRILLPDSIRNQLISALHQAGKQEIGGVLMGEYVEGDAFRVKVITIQPSRGTIFTFKRLVQHVLAPLRRFFRETSYNYMKFNYLGEWHSHPSFGLEPSSIDSETMWELVEDPQVGANFAVLLIVRLIGVSELDGTVSIYLPDYQSFKGELVQENHTL